jgi:tetratricopeptide (TPR) repeat protein
MQAIRLDPEDALYHQTLGPLFLYDRITRQPSGRSLRALKWTRSCRRAQQPQADLPRAGGLRGRGASPGRLWRTSYPTPEFAAYNLGNALYQLGDYARRAEAYERSLAILPDNPEGRFQLGMSYARLGRLAEAEKAFDVALQMRADAVRTRYELGMVLFKLGRREDAAGQFRRVVELDARGELGEQSRTYLKLLK